MIIGGDFNSASHLDWTKATTAAGLYNGYGPVSFPTSNLMLEKGFQDSYRKANENEVAFPGGTFSVTHGFADARIDFIYFKGARVVASKIIRNPAEIDYIWPGDHAAVLSTFKLEDK